jgi:hypothetical protein
MGMEYWAMDDGGWGVNMRRFGQPEPKGGSFPSPGLSRMGGPTLGFERMGRPNPNGVASFPSE